MTERLKFQGRLVEKELEARRLKLRIEGLRDSVRDILDPFDAIEELRVDTAFEQMSDLAARWLEHKELVGEIKALRKALGRE
ncbi:MAG: hypothetical protein ABIJ57_05490 [Pseudomonadota bacterium]